MPAPTDTDWPDGLQPASPQAAGFDPDRIETAFGVVAKAVESGDIPGAVALVGKDGLAVGPRAYGWAMIEPDRRPMTPDTRFDLASVTKVMATTTAALLLVERGEIRLADPVRRFLPEVPDTIRVWHLLTHTTGLPSWAAVHQSARTPAEAVQHIAALGLEAEPGTRVKYSCLGFILLGELIHKASGQALEAFCAAEIFGPLGMRDTTFNPAPSERANVAATERNPRTGEILTGCVHDENARAIGGVSGNAGLFGTARDAGIFCQATVNGGQFDGFRLLQRVTVELAARDHTAEIGSSWGLGWMRKGHARTSSAGDLFPTSAIGHTGFTGTSIWIDPGRRLFAVLLTNRVHPTRQNQAHVRLRPLFHNAVAAALND